MKKSRGSLFSNTYDILEDKQIFIVLGINANIIANFFVLTSFIRT